MQNSTPAAAAVREASVTVFVPGMLRKYCDGEANLNMTASTVRAALEQLEQRYPALYSCVCDETGTVRRHLNIFVNSLNTRDGEGVDTPLSAGDVVTILTAVSGG